MAARGRRAGGGDTRSGIVEAARALFAAQGFDGTSVRAVAREAGVDPALVHHYFDGKVGLFAEVIGVPAGIEDEIAAAVAGPPESVGERVVRTFLRVWDSPEGRARFQAMVGAVAAHEGAAQALRDFVSGTVLTRLAAGAIEGEPVSELAVASAGAQLVGMGMLRYVVRLPAMVEADPEEVVALLAGGGYAEVVAVPEGQLLPAPEGMGLIDAAGVVEAAATVVSNLVLEAGMREGETVLVHGGTGGIGTVAIQLAKGMDARVLTTVGSDDALPIVAQLGADQAWNRRIIDLPAAVREAGGADVILDVVGGSALADNVAMLNEGGRLVIIGTLGGASGELPIGQLMAKRARVIGSTLRSRPVENKAAILEATRYLVWPLLASGAIQVPIHARLPLEQAADAHTILREGGHIGKVILEVAPPSGDHRRGRRRKA